MHPLCTAGFSLILDTEQGSLLLSRARIIAKVKQCASLVPHVSTVDEVSIGTALAVVHAYINQIKQVNLVSSAYCTLGGKWLNELVILSYLFLAKTKVNSLLITA